jgi:hypothetical protein
MPSSHAGKVKCSKGNLNAAVFVSSAKVQVCQCDRRSSDLHDGIVLGFNPRLESSVVSDPSDGVDLAKAPHSTWKRKMRPMFLTLIETLF